MRRKRVLALLAFVAVIALTGCTKAEEETPLVVIEQDEEEIQFDFATVTTDDVVLTKRVKCVYRQLKDEELAFSLDGKRVDRVYVKKGDQVKKGDLVAQLSGGNLDRDIKRLEYYIARNELLKQHAETNEALDISERWVNAISHGANHNVEEDVARIQRNYRYMQEDYDDALELDRMELQRLKAEKNASSLYAGMDGVVYDVMNGLEGSTSEKDAVVITIIDTTECLFETETPENIPYYREGVPIQMSITTTNAAGDYILLPWNPTEWGDKQYFSIQTGPDNDGIEVGTSGYMQLVLEEKKQVLSVPVETVYKAGDKYYVYVLGANQMREVRWVTIGLYGDSRVEIVSGLAEGDKVILK